MSRKKTLRCTGAGKSKSPEVGTNPRNRMNPRNRQEANGVGLLNTEGAVGREPREAAWGWMIVAEVPGLVPAEMQMPRLAPQGWAQGQTRR